MYYLMFTRIFFPLCIYGSYPLIFVIRLIYAWQGMLPTSPYLQACRFSLLAPYYTITIARWQNRFSFLMAINVVCTTKERRVLDAFGFGVTKVFPSHAMASKVGLHFRDPKWRWVGVALALEWRFGAPKWSFGVGLEMLLVILLQAPVKSPYGWDPFSFVLHLSKGLLIVHWHDVCAPYFWYLGWLPILFFSCLEA